MDQGRLGVMASLRVFIAVAVGGAGGAVSRWGVLASTPADLTDSITWVINVLGSIGLGVLVGRRELLSAELMAAAGTGFAGGFTTFSAYALSVATAVDNGQLDDALIIGLATPLVALVGAGVGYRISRRSVIKARKAAARRAASDGDGDGEEA